MLYKLDENGCVINEAKINKIQSYYKPIICELNQLYRKKFNDNLLSIYIRGSVSVRKARIGISDFDSVALLKKRLTKDKLFWTVRASRDLECKYPKAGMIEMTVLSWPELLTSKQYNNLKIYLKTQSVCLYGKDILPLLPAVKPGKKLALKMHQGLPEEISRLGKIFSGQKVDKKYLFRKRSYKFWCVWTMRTFLRAGLGLVMCQKPVYTQDLKTCYQQFSKIYPQYKSEMHMALKWSVDPIDNRKILNNYLDNFGEDLANLWRQIK